MARAQFEQQFNGPFFAVSLNANVQVSIHSLESGGRISEHNANNITDTAEEGPDSAIFSRWNFPGKF